MATSVGSALKWWARTKGDEVAIRLDDDVITYRQLEHWSSRLARALAYRGVQPGDRVGLLSPNALQWPICALAIVKTGAVLVPMNSRLKAAEIRKTADDAGVTLVIAAPEQCESARAASALGDEFDVIGFDVTDQLASGEVDDFCIDRTAEEPIALIFTSGSTGMSKGVILTMQTLMGIVLENTLTEEGFRPGTVSMVVVPLAFTPGLVYGLLMTILLGGTLIVEPDLNPVRAVTLIERHSVRALFSVPLVYERLSRTEEFESADLSSLQTALIGGSAVPVELLHRWAAKGVMLRQIYGMTESGGVATATLKDETLEHPHSCGSGSIFTEVRVMNEDGSLAEAGELGELVMRGPGVTPGYWNDPSSTAAALRDGWLHSGDLGTADGEGRIRFVDRLKDLIITGGINVSPVELEGLIARLEGVAEVAVIAAADDRFGETPAAIITVAEGHDQLDEAAVIAHCESAVSDYKVPRYVVLNTDPLPRLPSGKIDKRTIRDRYKNMAEKFTRAR